MNVLPVMPTNCATCPWRHGSPYAYLQDTLAASALSDRSRICHSTGPRNAVNKRPPCKKPKLCRGARDLQLRYFTAIGFIAAPTDEAWAAKVAEMEEAKRHG